ncbi:thiamine pyrophosphate-dependent enzyme [Nocardia africana]|uniref:Alpha-keto-acid decarboxylase n=1 Tax=Nocardia africana TaxID=134964 RepID=A0A378WZZ7_9NOCA|nr:thiamine pyrophosphate-dependent enzyme [Nocardia africana]MCC3312343.1 thiamine pyrophosphate-dependent enzyme [Nocardia africana]SUA46347.1 Alpha-keto-acid decarboxylase [Nocardia africana]
MRRDRGRRQAIHSYIRPGDVLLVDNGTSYALFGLQLPPGCTFVGSVNWGSIGYAVAALLGTLTAAPERRHLLFVGDGSFQLTVQELSTILRRDHKPVIFLINNGGYTMRPDTTARSFVAETPADLHNALAAPNDRLIFVESIMDRFDSPAAVTSSSNRGAELDYGPRGPQHQEGAQLRPA